MTGDAIFERIAAAAALPEPADRARLRRALGIRQREVALAIGVSPQSVWAWETGRSEPTGAHRKRYAELLAAMRQRLGEQTGD
ncbi:helix-turn-helix domain-containing protein [Pseudonocardia sichuanensis]